MSGFGLLVHVLLSFGAFQAARDWERVWGRALGLGWLIVRGGFLTLAGFGEGGAMVLVVGLVTLGMAGLAWWWARA